LTTEKLNKINRNDITRSSGTPSGLNNNNNNNKDTYIAQIRRCSRCAKYWSGSKSLSAKRLVGETSAPPYFNRCMWNLMMMMMTMITFLPS